MDYRARALMGGAPRGKGESCDGRPTVTSPVPREVWESLIRSDPDAVVAQSGLARRCLRGQALPGRKRPVRVSFRTARGDADGAAPLTATLG